MHWTGGSWTESNIQLQYYQYYRLGVRGPFLGPWGEKVQEPGTTHQTVKTSVMKPETVKFQADPGKISGSTSALHPTAPLSSPIILIIICVSYRQSAEDDPMMFSAVAN